MSYPHIIQDINEIENLHTSDVTVIQSDIETVTNKLNDYLPLSGGTMTGNIVWSNTSHIIAQENDTWNTLDLQSAYPGAGLYLRSCLSPSSPGTFAICAMKEDGTDVSFHGSPNGELWWNNRLILWLKDSNQQYTGWYRVYPDGWIEQGGRFDLGSLIKDVTQTITFPINFSNTNYTLLTQASRNNNASDSINNQCFINYRTTTTFQARCYGDGTTQYVDWYACGT